jgi:hypothetical protein
VFKEILNRALITQATRDGGHHLAADAWLKQRLCNEGWAGWAATILLLLLLCSEWAELVVCLQVNKTWVRNGTCVITGCTMKTHGHPAQGLLLLQRHILKFRRACVLTVH